jgi:hypothetical protein
MVSPSTTMYFWRRHSQGLRENHHHEEKAAACIIRVQLGPIDAVLIPNKHLEQA